uniref:Putative secreted protein n=1 Tax=Anopheles darlingi TaxID=43151 RepID=A0A2M4D4G0_ANODA
MPSISQKLAACIFLVTASSYGVDALAGRSITVVACRRFWLKMLFAASLCKTIIKDRCSDRTRNGRNGIVITLACVTIIGTEKWEIIRSDAKCTTNKISEPARIQTMYR